MAKLSISFLLIFCFSQQLAAQNFYYVRSNSSSEEKSKLLDQLKFLSEQFDIKNVTFAIIVSELPDKIEATTEYSFNHVVQRQMILIRLNKNLAQHKTLRVLAHEMVHAYQYCSKELVRHTRKSFTFRGVKYKNVMAIPHSKRPWEIEAIQYAQQFDGEAGEIYSVKN